MKLSSYLLIVFFLLVTKQLVSQTNQLAWAVSYGFSDTELVNEVEVDDKGNVYISGDFRGTVDFDPGPGVFNLTSSGIDDVFIQKLDSNGNFVWAKSIGSIGDDQTYSIAVDNKNNIYVTGYYEGTVDFDPSNGVTNLVSAGGQDIYILKLDFMGNFKWAKSLGGLGHNVGLKVKTDINGNVYTTGVISNTVDLDPGVGVNIHSSNGNSDAFLSKLDSSGNYIWSKSIGGTFIDRGVALAIDDQENVYLGGAYTNTVDFDPGAGSALYTAAGSFDCFIQKYNNQGNMIWTKSFGGTSQEYIRGLTIDSLKNIYLAGDFSHTGDFDPGVGASNLTAMSSIGHPDIFIEKLDSIGNLIWVKQIGGEGNKRAGNNIVVDKLGHVFITGHFDSTLYVNPNSTTFHLNALGGLDVFVEELNGSGNFIWATSVGGTDYDYTSSITIDKNDDLIVAGYYSSNSIDFDFNSGTNLQFSNGQTDIFAFKIDREPRVVGIPKENYFNQLNVFPNPTTGKFLVEMDVENDISSIRIMNIHGKLIEEIHSFTRDKEIEIKGKSGVYFVEIISGNFRSITKLIKQ